MASISSSRRCRTAYPRPSPRRLLPIEADPRPIGDDGTLAASSSTALRYHVGRDLEQTRELFYRGGPHSMRGVRAHCDGHARLRQNGCGMCTQQRCISRAATLSRTRRGGGDCLNTPPQPQSIGCGCQQQSLRPPRSQVESPQPPWPSLALGAPHVAKWHTTKTSLEHTQVPQGLTLATETPGPRSLALTSHRLSRISPPSASARSAL